MSFDEILLDTEEHFEKSLAAMDKDFRRIRTGRATAEMLDHVHVEAYGAMTPLKQLAGITVPEPTQLLIKPYDKSIIKDIERALVNAELGMAPQNDGQLIRLNVPPLSEERRKQLAGNAKEAGEKAKIAMRNARRDGIKQVEAKGKEDKLPEDLVKQTIEQISETLKEYEGKVEAALKAKVDDLLNL